MSRTPALLRLPWVRDSAGLALGTAAGQVLLAVSAFVVVRLYEPAELGTAAVFTAVVGLGAIFLTLRYDLAIPLERDDDSAKDALQLSLVVLAVTSLLAAVALVTLSSTGLRTSLPQSLVGLRFLLLPALLVAGLTNVLASWSTRLRAYRPLAFYRITTPAVQVVAQIGAGLAGAGAVGLAGGSVTGTAAGGLTLLRGSVSTLRTSLARLSVRRIRTVARTHWRLPTFSLLAAACQAVALPCLPIFVASLYDLRTAGVVALAQRVVSLPISSLGEAASRTFLGDAAAMRREDSAGVAARFRSTAVALTALAVVPTTIVLLWGPALFSAAFGSTWRDAGSMARPLVLLAALQLVATPLNQTLLVLDRLGLQVSLSVLRLCLTVGPLLWAHAHGADAVTAVAWFSAGGVLGYLATVVAMDRVAQQRDRS